MHVLIRVSDPLDIIAGFLQLNLYSLASMTVFMVFRLVLYGNVYHWPTDFDVKLAVIFP